MYMLLFAIITCYILVQEKARGLETGIREEEEGRRSY